MSPSVVALIPARAGSKRLPGKNKRLLAGQPLIAWTIAAAKASGVFSGIAVSTDDDEIKALAYAMGVDVIQRYPEHATDTSPDIEWVQATMQRSLRYDCGHIDELYSAFAILRPTSPFRSAATIRAAWEAFSDFGERFDSLRAMQPATQNPCKMWWVGEGQLAVPFCEHTSLAGVPHHSMPTQQLAQPWVQNASLEIAHVQTVTEQHSISGSRVAPWLMPGFEGFDINTETDLLFAESLVEKGLVTLPEIA